MFELETLLCDPPTINSGSPREGPKGSISFAGAHTFEALAVLGPFPIWSLFPPPLPSHVVTRWTARRQEDYRVVDPGDSITAPLVVPRFPVSYSLSPLHAKRASASPSLPSWISIHPFTVTPFCVTPFPRRGPRCHYTVIYRSEITFSASVYLPLLICALFIFGNRLLKKQHTHTHTHTRSQTCELLERSRYPDSSLHYPSLRFRAVSILRY